MCRNFKKNGFSLIYNQKTLKIVINFLEKRFRWDPKVSASLFQHLKKQKFKAPRAAAHVKNGNIVIAILLFHQGWSRSENKNIINFSSWFADKNFRGLEVILFAKKLSISLNRYVITNYTPNPLACKILKALKYKDMSVKKEVIGFSKIFPFIRLVSFFNFVTIKNNLNKPKDIKKNIMITKSNDLLFNIREIRKFKIIFSELSIYSSKNNFKISFIWLLIMIIKYRVIRVNCFTKSDNEPTLNTWLIKNSIKENYIFPACSELVI